MFYDIDTMQRNAVTREKSRDKALSWFERNAAVHLEGGRTQNYPANYVTVNFAAQLEVVERVHISRPPPHHPPRTCVVAHLVLYDIR